MKRELKVKAWHKVKNRWESPQDVKLGFVDKSNCVQFEADNAIEFVLYTGQDDIKGKEIYEGDIVQFFISCGRPIRHVVIWYHSEYRTVDVHRYVTCSCCGNKIHQDSGTKPTQAYWRKFEVVGNIYENKELLKR